MSRCGVVIGAMVLYLIAGPVSAQPPGAGFGQLGMGGFGPGGPGMPATLMSLIGIPDVQKEIGLSDQQTKGVSTLTSETQRQVRSAMSGINFQELQGMSEDKRQQVFAEVRERLKMPTSKPTRNWARFWTRSNLAGSINYDSSARASSRSVALRSPSSLA